MENFFKAFPKILFYSAIVLCFVAGATYFVAIGLGKSMTEINLNIVIPKNIIDILPNNGEGLLVSHFPIWSIALAILVFVSAIIGYYGGLYSWSYKEVTKKWNRAYSKSLYVVVALLYPFLYFLLLFGAFWLFFSV